jgi:hypothetical protein
MEIGNFQERERERERRQGMPYDINEEEWNRAEDKIGKRERIQERRGLIAPNGEIEIKGDKSQKYEA